VPPIFSTRTAWDLTESSLSAAIRHARSTSRRLLDLTVSNPTVCGFNLDPEALLDPLQNHAALTYDPNPRGHVTAREAVSVYYAGHAASVDPSDVVLTTSTSEAYSFLFRLLCDPGDQVLVAQPSYPLFDFLASLDDVVLQPYPLFHDFGWWIDFAELERRITPRTRAILLVHPNNPTGHPTNTVERHQLEALCLRHNLALIVDEVFLDYSLTEAIASFATGPHSCLTFVLSGLSKIAALPQMKVAWLVACGPDDIRESALARLEVIADTFLSMNAPSQLALPDWLGSREEIQTQILTRLRANLAAITTIDHIPVQAGWSAILQLPQWLGSPNLAERLVIEAGVITHPAGFYAIPGDHRIVVSLIVAETIFQQGINSLAQWSESSKLTS
jgi:aspartate/methionine/tyrosine aminotransferase